MGVGWVGGWFACCPDAVFLSFCDFRASHCGHLKQGVAWGKAARLWLPLLGSGWHCPLAPNGGHILVWCTNCARALCSPQGMALDLVEQPSPALSWLRRRP